ncbi:MAG: hypothetical protein ABI551_10970 [Polyangiaceae bacterium]
MPATVQAFDHHHHHSSDHSSDGGGGCSSPDSSSSTVLSPPPPPAPSPKHVFVTSALYTGAIGSANAADARCQERAVAAGLSGSFTAWISDGTTNAYDRTADVGPWYTTRGELAFAQKSDLRNGSPATDLLDENANPASVDGAWSGTTAAGLASGNDCDGWTNAGAGVGASIGSALGLDTSWGGDDTTATCDGKAALICFQQ